MNFKEKQQKLKEGNPFYGLKSLLSLIHEEKNVSPYILNAWNESKSDKEKRELFNIIMFNIGSVDRSNNVFRKNKIENGGKSINDQWIVYLRFLLKNNVAQFVEFLKYQPEIGCSLFFEFVSPREFMYYQIKTQPKTKRVIGSWGLLKEIIDNKDESIYNTLLDTIENYIRNGSEFQKWQMAKMIHTPKYSKRQKKNKEGNIVEGGRPLQKETKDKFDAYETLCDDISKRMDWYVIDYGNNKKYTGFLEWRREFIKNTEYVLFSSKNISKKDQTEFLEWLNTLPAGSRYRVKRRLSNPANEVKYKTLKQWFNVWEEYKKEKQKEVRILEEKAKTVGLDADEKVQLHKANKEAKVNTGADTVGKHALEFLSGRTDDVTTDALVKKSKLDVPVLLCVDISGSMGWSVSINNVNYYPRDAARLISTMIMLKNPPSHRNLLITFGSEATCYTDNAQGTYKQNRFMTGKNVAVKTLVDTTKTFMENYNNLSNIIGSSGGGTNVAIIADKIKEWVKNDDGISESVKTEQLAEYQIILIVSDNEFNNSSTQQSSLLQFKQKLYQYFGWNGVIAIWDTAVTSNNKSSYFENIDNVVHITGTDPNVLNQLFSKLSDIDIIDVYTILKSIYESNRWNLIKQYTV
ncbi:MAG TPA: hypothetical protein PKD00_01375 [Burkholderiales bacterium]|nr:hypothetical protein [Burkholderiales bacterium]